MSRLLIAILLLPVFLLSVVAAGQDAPMTFPSELPKPETGGEPAAPALVTDPVADEAYKPLARDFRNLYLSLRNKGSVGEADRGVISGLRDRAAQFSREFPNDPRGLAVQLQTSIWLEDDDLVSDLYERILKTPLDQEKVRLSWANLLKSQNRYPEMLEVLEQGSFDFEKTPDAALALSDALFAEQRFQDALEALKSIPQAVLENNIFVKLRYDEMIKPREEYPSLWEQEQSERAKEQAADDLPRALLVTDRGTIILELFEDHAPNTVANFVDLAEQGFYNGTTFHRVEPNFMAQGGDPNSKEGATGVAGQGGPGYYIRDEVERPDYRRHFTGTLAMAKTEPPNTGGSQFYITHQPTAHLNGKHTVFGRVLEGLDVARALEKGDVIRSITVIRKRSHDYKPETLPLTGAAAAVPPAPGAPTRTTTPAVAVPLPEPAPPAPPPAPAPADQPPPGEKPAEPKPDGTAPGDQPPEAVPD